MDENGSFPQTYWRALCSMTYREDLELIISCFKKCRLAAKLVTYGNFTAENAADELERLMSGAIPQAILSRATDEKTLYRFKDSFGLRYRYVRLDDELLVVGI